MASKELKKIYKGSFKDRVPRFDDGGGIDYVSAGPSANYIYQDDSDNIGSGTPVTVNNGAGLSDTGIGSSNNASASELANEAQASSGVGDLNTGSYGDSSGSSKSSNSSSSSTTNTAAGALGSLLKSLGLGSSSASNASVLNALLGGLSAAGAYKTNKAAATLPTMPTLPGGANTTGLGAFAPTKLAAANAAGSTGIGTGNAPLTQTNYASPSYYTYGQGPEKQYFQQVNPNGGQIAPVTMKTGGTVKMKRFDAGGIAAPTSMAPISGPFTPPVQAAPSGGAMQMPGMMPQGGASPVGMPGPASNTAPVMPRTMPGAAPVGNPGPAPVSAPAMQKPLPAAAPAAPQGALSRPAPPSTMMQRMQAAHPMNRGVHMADGGSASLPPGFGIPPGGYNAPQVNMAQSKLETGSGNGLGRGPRKVGVSNANPGMATGGALSGALSASQPMASRHIQGPGDGTSDSIPARLASGEYVLSADVVSGLGNGENGAGAKKLDEFVKNLRKHKAQNGAKGTLPADAKPIPHYMGKSK